MSGFKNFILKGNLVDLAVAVIIGTSFAAVVKAFTDVLLAYVGKVGGANTVGAMVVADVDIAPFVNAVIAFLILAAVVYFFVVMPYTKARERFFPADAGGPTEVELLTDIRNALVNRD
ncbi:MscL family protein [Nocardioides daeguensis]|uniref:Large-conductance mechanosensitive channel protein MscL n=1 Tax=Nocardioides daeguensis TaxID=908359 RepID=A0ABP6UZA1_9ACTN|nr:MscL family protein [Nocardioides daeguensis]MBV6727163.1 MscL family protein [Nocardioides daeguensis]MCR1771177.1 MscL family protein [Nocardioides daeguensis]